MKDKYGIEWTDMEITVFNLPEPPPPDTDVLTVEIPEDQVQDFRKWWVAICP